MNRAWAELPSAWKINSDRWVSLSVCHKFHILSPEVHVHRASASLRWQVNRGPTSLFFWVFFLKQFFFCSIHSTLPAQWANSSVNQRQPARAPLEHPWSTPAYLHCTHFSYPFFISCGEGISYHFPYRKKKAAQFTCWWKHCHTFHWPSLKPLLI